MSVSIPDRSLDAIFAPRNIAVIGATEAVGSVGRSVFENLLPLGDRVIPVNLKRASVLGRTAFPNLASLPPGSEIDLAVIATPAATVPGIVRECGQAGVRGAVIVSAGFKEVGSAGAALELQILAEARRHGLRVIGPNCLGVMSPHAGLNATFAASIARPGKVAFISQSGALCTAILDWSFRENVGFSAFVSIGSMLDVGWGDLIAYFGDDPRTDSIVCYMESVGDARAFLRAAREVARRKPIIVLKVGRTADAAKAAASHTGALTGSDEVLDAAFRRVGVLRVSAISELFGMAEILAKQPRPRGPRLAIVTNAGGPGALATDTLIRAGGRLAELSDSLRAELDRILPAPWSHHNPIDILGDAGAERFAETVDLVARDPGNDGLLVILTPQAMTDARATAEALRPFARLSAKPILASWMGGGGIEAGESILNAAGIPTFRFPDAAARAFALMWRFSENLHVLDESALVANPAGRRTEAGSQPAGARADAAVLLDAVRQSGRTLLTEFESKQLLAAYGLPTVETRLAASEDAAVGCAEQIGFPVVVKLNSETITHKTDVGGVRLNLQDSAAVRAAWRGIEAGVREKSGPGHFQGVTVQPMVAVDGYELILGSSLDPQFGPILLFGSGGQLVEVYHDRALGLPPLNAFLARRVMEQTRIFAALLGVRGRRAVDLAALEQFFVRFAELVIEQRGIAEIDINPLIASPDRLIALDARVVLHDAGVTEGKWPPVAMGLDQPPPRATESYESATGVERAGGAALGLGK